MTKQSQTIPFPQNWRNRAGLSPQELMAITGASRSFVYRAINEGRIKAARVGPRKLIIPIAEVEKLLEVQS